VFASITLGGCVDGFQGANIQVDLSPFTPVQGPVIGAPDPTANELPAAVHFAIYAIQESTGRESMFEVSRFEIHRIVDKSSPCFIDVGEHVPHPGLHVTAFAERIKQDTGITDLANPPAGATEQQKELVATAEVRMQAIDKLVQHADPRNPMNMGGIVAVTSASPATYPMMASTCDGPPDQIPPPACMDEASNKLRLQLCQAAWKADPDLWEGTDRVLTAPLNGITHGMMDLQTGPISPTPIGGAQFFVDNALDNIDAYAIYFQVDGMDTPGTQLYFGRPTMPTRGVAHVHLVSPINPALTAEMAVFIDLGEDDVHF
jgi:hypothetical protein